MKTYYKRRTFNKIFALSIGISLLVYSQRNSLLAASNKKEGEVQIKELNGLMTVAPKPLSKEARKILEESETEPPFSSNLLYEKRKGTYHCAKCENLLFTSEMKYDSGTGWPSFHSHVPGSIKKKLDISLFFIPRIEYHCARCGGHQGHVFKDGPKPSFLRWCNNGLALEFKPSK